jgi:transcriptional regulator with XRE-family HTH domain
MPTKRPSRTGNTNLSGTQIREIRRSLGKTLADLAAELDMDFGIKLDRSVIGKIERGKRRITDVELLAIACALGVRVDVLLPASQVDALTERSTERIQT